MEENNNDINGLVQDNLSNVAGINNNYNELNSPIDEESNLATSTPGNRNILEPQIQNETSVIQESVSAQNESNVNTVDIDMSNNQSLIDMSDSVIETPVEASQQSEIADIQSNQVNNTIDIVQSPTSLDNVEIYDPLSGTAEGDNNQVYDPSQTLNSNSNEEKKIKLPLIVGIVGGVILIIIIVIILIVNFSGKTLTCSYDEEMDSYNTYMLVEVKYKKDKPNYIKSTAKYDYSNTGISESDLDQLVDYYSSNSDGTDGSENIKVDRNGKVIIISGELSGDRMIANSAEYNTSYDYDTLKKRYEDMGYKCK